MCGIIGYYNKEADWKTAKERVMEALEQQKTRGQDSFGIAISNPGTKLVRYRTCSMKDLEANKIWEKIGPKSFVLVHNRAATSTHISWMMAHPFFNESHDISMVHNGMITGHIAEYEALAAKGHVFETAHTEQTVWDVRGKTFGTTKEVKVNDSEVLMHHYEEHGMDEAFFMLGSLACVFIDVRPKKDVMIVVKKDKPVFYDVLDDGCVLFASYKGLTNVNSESILEVSREGTFKVVKEGRKSEVGTASSYRGAAFRDDKRLVGGRGLSEEEEEGFSSSGYNYSVLTSPEERAKRARGSLEWEKTLSPVGQAILARVRERALLFEGSKQEATCDTCEECTRIFYDSITAKWLCEYCRESELFWNEACDVDPYDLYTEEELEELDSIGAALERDEQHRRKNHGGLPMTEREFEEAAEREFLKEEERQNYIG
jgi:hypothetical protein